MDQTLLRTLVEGTASDTGRDFHRSLVWNLTRALDTTGAWLTEFDERTDTLKALAFWYGDRFIDGFEYGVVGTPCETTIRAERVVHIPDRAISLYPGDGVPMPGPAVSYLGVAFRDGDHRVLGHLAVVDEKPIPAEPRVLDVFELFANRAGAELRRMRLEEALREREEKLRGLVGSAMDAIVELDGELRVTMLNAAAEKLFSCAEGTRRGGTAGALLGEAANAKLRTLAAELDRAHGTERSLWIPDGLVAEPRDCKAFPAEATLSRFEVRGRPFYTLILRNVDDRLEAERRIRALTDQADYLRSELAAEHGFHEIVGGSPALLEALRGVSQVAATDATVLLTGETGTGKELFARAIHDRSARREGPLVKVNCAAIPAALIESEFFGHERGAFTGATQRREGRFSLADGGTLFLDELGELPLELQGKLLRVLQEGEFEPVGGTRTRKVDVRVVAATNRDLAREVREGRFREDLYFRLSVFPLRLPPLRERGDDVVLLARALTEQLSRALGKRVAPPGPADAAALRSYGWPGNVRELRNVLERAIITSTDGRLHLERALPAPASGSPAATAAPTPAPGELLTERGLRELERRNTLAVLERCGWRVAGEGGAAELLGVSPSTLKSRMKALAIARPA
ncbi:MAG: sigma 54-interacting transcriptional regulator [Anaeromyxobacter sp.]